MRTQKAEAGQMLPGDSSQGSQREEVLAVPGNKHQFRRKDCAFLGYIPLLTLAHMKRNPDGQSESSWVFMTSFLRAEF